MSRLEVRNLRGPDRDEVLRYLEQQPLLNLGLIDQASRLGRGRAGLLGAYDGPRLAGVAAVQPSVVLDARAGRDALEALMPHLAGIGSGLVKSTEDVVAPLWEWLEARGRRALLDRIETGYALFPDQGEPVGKRAGAEVREARRDDLDALVEAARASLREENRPDAFRGDPLGFRRWVRSRIPRATVVTWEGQVAFVGYADVQCSRGWLLQGVYTWPALRRMGVARIGVAAMCERAFASGADHVQLAVVEGNSAAEALYEGLGFRSFGRLRTLLFS